MKRLSSISLVALIFISTFIGCSKKNTNEPDTSRQTCGEGKGFPVEFCRQVDHYEAGYGVPGEDVITVDCLVGPEGATVSNQKNGTYYCAGTYKLSTYSNAEIDLNWGGSTQYAVYEHYEIHSKGEGSFSLKVQKTSGGSGNIFLSMSSGSKWMFDTVLVNTNCDQAAKTLNKIEINEADAHTESDGYIEKRVNRIYH
ncbi:hypothetical protein JW835_09530 [bacterium]|nr:hypothetical protein [bacterium]